MELKDDEFQALRLKVDQISSELDKQNTVRVVNTKWMIIVGAVILSALGFTSFVQLPREANRAVEEKVGKNIMNIANDLIRISKRVKEEDFVNLPIGTIVPSMLKPADFAVEVGDPPEFDSVKSKWVLADGGKVKDNKKDLNKSKYFTLTGKTLPPDLRGMFLRGMNVYGGQDPEQNRTAGDYQPDALQEHYHVTIELTGYKEGVAEPHPRNIGYTRNPNARNAPIIKESVLNVKDAKTAVETRPKNVAVYFYIKIN